MNKNKILVVDDDTSLLEGYIMALGANDFETLKAQNGQEGLDIALAEKPDLILLDIMMPIMDGLTMLQKLRQENDYGAKVPVILLTNLNANSEDVVKKVVETGPAFYLIKSDYTFQQVVGKVKELLGLKK